MFSAIFSKRINTYVQGKKTQLEMYGFFQRETTFMSSCRLP